MPDCVYILNKFRILLAVIGSIFKIMYIYDSTLYLYYFEFPVTQL